MAEWNRVLNWTNTRTQVKTLGVIQACNPITVAAETGGFLEHTVQLV